MDTRDIFAEINRFIVIKSGSRSAPHIKLALWRFAESLPKLTRYNPALIRQVDIDNFAGVLRYLGLGPSAINSSLSYVNVFLNWLREDGVKLPMFNVPWVSRPKPNKWWLSPHDYETKLRPWLVTQLNAPPYGTTRRVWWLTMQFIEFTIETGLRIEETLRLIPSDFTGRHTSEPSLIVPGTKTAGSKATVPLSAKAYRIAEEMMDPKAVARVIDGDQRLFPIAYDTLKHRWQDCRKHLGALDQPTATLKSLRRTFAANCLSKGLPQRIIQDLMRHTSEKTTLEYLRLVGLSNTPQVRAMLNQKPDSEKAGVGSGNPPSGDAKWAIHAYSYGAGELKAAGYSAEHINLAAYMLSQAFDVAMEAIRNAEPEDDLDD